MRHTTALLLNGKAKQSKEQRRIDGAVAAAGCLARVGNVWRPVCAGYCPGKKCLALDTNSLKMPMNAHAHTHSDIFPPSTISKINIYPKKLDRLFMFKSWPVYDKKFKEKSVDRHRMTIQDGSTI